jgi:hypothetical protein
MLRLLVGGAAKQTRTRKLELQANPHAESADRSFAQTGNREVFLQRWIATNPRM